MKQSDFDRLKAVCEKEGFELCYEWPTDGDNLFVVQKAKDIWEGVEFAECVLNSESYTIGKTYKINPEFLPSIKTYQDDFGRENGMASSYFKPSTESAYIEQLKEEAFKRFGEIKHGDRFDRNWETINEKYYGVGVIGEYVEDGFNYRKSNDALMFRGTTIYLKGNWATRVKERVKVNCSDIIANQINTRTDFMFSITTRCINEVDFKSFLASKLEEYLNKE